MIDIDGAQGEGGGQVLRTALSLSACLGVPVHIRNIRQGRTKPGLMRQHLACVQALAEICSAEVQGAFMGSKAVQFIPGAIKAGNYRFAVGSAGSSTLVFQTVLPALLLAKQVSQLTLIGGTHNPLAPSFDAIQYSFLPLLRQMGCEFETTLHSYGFYPVGAGQWTISIKPPSVFKPLRLETRGQRLNATALCIGAKIPGHVLAREKQRLLKRLKWSEDSIRLAEVESLGSGNSVIAYLNYPQITEVVESHGAIGITAEKVADNVIDAIRQYEHYAAPVGHYLADQLLLPLCLAAGGSFVTGPLSEHCKTNIQVIQQLLAVDIQVETIEAQKQWRISVLKS